jgi:putative ABC transport system permease protein
MLIKVRTGGFDPPPSVMAIPWGDLTITVQAVVAALGTAPMKASPIRMSLPGLYRPAVQELRDL